MTQEDDIKITFLISEMKKKAEADSCPTDSEKLAAWCRKVAAVEPLAFTPVLRSLPSNLSEPTPPFTFTPNLPEPTPPFTFTPEEQLNPIRAYNRILSEDPRPHWAIPLQEKQDLADRLSAMTAVNQVRKALNSPQGTVFPGSGTTPLRVDTNAPAIGTGSLVPVSTSAASTATDRFLEFLQNNQANIAAGAVGAGVGRMSQPANPEAGMFGGIAGGVGGRLAFQKLMELAGNSLASGSPAAQTILNYGVRPAMALAGSLLGSRGATKLFGSTPPKPKVDPVKQRQLELYRNLAQASGRRGA